MKTCIIYGSINGARCAYYKRIAPAEDLRFLLRFASPSLASQIAVLLAGKPTAHSGGVLRTLHRIGLQIGELATVPYHLPEVKARIEAARLDRVKRYTNEPQPTDKFQKAA